MKLPTLSIVLLHLLPVMTPEGTPHPIPPPQEAERPVVVASKPFAESYLLAEVFAQLLESRGYTVDRRLGLGSTEVVLQAVRSGDVDVYPEYTGTGLLAVLGEAPRGSSEEVFERVAREFEDRWGIRWLPSLGFENTYAVSVRTDTAEKLQLRTLSDLVGAAPGLTAGFSPDFLGRHDGLPGLAEAYGLTFREVRSLLQAVKYEALRTGSVDVVDAYSTDGRLAGGQGVILEDDLGFFPPYDAAPVLGSSIVQDSPGVADVLGELEGTLDEVSMREWNRRLEVDREPVHRVAAALLQELGLVEADHSAPEDVAFEETDVAISPGTDPPHLVAYMWAERETLGRQTLRHLLLVLVSLVAATLVAVPLGLLLERARARAEGVIRVVGMIQTIPSIALLAFMIPLLGVGILPAVVALFLYSLFPILRNTFTGVRDAAPPAVDAAVSLGMTPAQVLWKVRLPLAAPTIMAGVRTAAVINVGTATLAAFIGAGGLGDPIVAGLSLADTRMILSGAIPAAALAMFVDAALAMSEGRLRPPVSRV